MWRACPVEGLGVLPHQVVVVALGMALWIEGAAVVATVGRKDVAQSDAGIEGPLATLAEAVLPAQVQETHDHLELVALALPFQVTIATACCQSDVETIQRVVVLAVAQPVAQLHGAIEYLVGVGVVGKCPPRCDGLDVEAPAVTVVYGPFCLQVRRQRAEQRYVGAQYPDRAPHDGGLRLDGSRRRWWGLEGVLVVEVLDDHHGVALQDDEGVASWRYGWQHGCRNGFLYDDHGITCWLPAQHGRGSAAQRCQVALQLAPEASAIELAQLGLAGVLSAGVGAFRLVENGQYLVAPGFVAGGNIVVELLPARSLVVDHDVAHAASQALPHQLCHSLSAMLTQPLVVGPVAFWRGA